MLAFAFLSVSLMFPVSTGIESRSSWIIPGMTRPQVEAILNEKPTTFMLSGGVASANIKVSYYNSRLLVSYGPDGKVFQSFWMKK